MNAISSQAVPETSPARLRELDLAHHLPAQQNYHLMQTLGGSRIITRAEGCYIHDADGNKILDGMAGLWCVNVGYGRAELADVAREQMLQLPFYNTFFRTATVPARAAGGQDRRTHRRQAAARVLQQLGLGGQRHRPAPGAPLLGPARSAQAQDLHQPLERLSRLDGRGREPWRHEARCMRRATCRFRASSTSCSRTSSATASAKARKHSRRARLARSSSASWRSGPSASRLSSANPCRARAV